MTKKKDLHLETEFAYHSSKLKLVEESRVALESINNTIEQMEDREELRSLASTLAETSLEEAVKVFDFSLQAAIYERKYKSAISAIATLFLLSILSNLIIGSIAFYLGTFR